MARVEHQTYRSLRNVTYAFFESTVWTGYRIDIRGKDRLEALHSSSIPAVFYFNHIASSDPVAVVHLMASELPERLSRLMMVVSEEYTHADNHLLYALGVCVGERMAGISMPRIEQAYRLRDPRLSSAERDKLRQKSEALGRAFKKLLTQELPQGASILIAPEGHRSSTGRLQPAEAGLGFIVKHMNRLGYGLIIPVGIYFIGDYQPASLNYHIVSKPTLIMSIGSPLNPGEVLDETRRLSGKRIARADQVSHILMDRLRILLPQSRWGVYDPRIFPETFQGAFTLETGTHGLVQVTRIKGMPGPFDYLLR